MNNFRAKDTTICWTPVDYGRGCDYDGPEMKTRGQMALIPNENPGNSIGAYDRSDLGCWAGIDSASSVTIKNRIMSIALGAIIRDGLDPAVVHRALWPLQEYREAVPYQMPPPKWMPAAVAG